MMFSWFFTLYVVFLVPQTITEEYGIVVHMKKDIHMITVVS